jgi:hypothetical protein
MAIFPLKGPQETVARRITQQCRNQFGHLILHAPGSGKTLIALHVFLNFGPAESISTTQLELDAFRPLPPISKDFTKDQADKQLEKIKAERAKRFQELIEVEDKRSRVVLVPAGIQDTFFTSGDIQNFKTSDQDTNGPSTMRSTYTIMTFKPAPGITRNFETCLQNEVNSGCSEEVKTTLTAMFQDKIVIVDEAHNLLKYLRDKHRNKIINAFRGAKRVILMTGTPILRFRSDLTLLLNLLETDVVLKDLRGIPKIDRLGNELVQKAPLYTDNDNVFDESYYMKTSQTTKQRLAKYFFDQSQSKAFRSLTTALIPRAANVGLVKFADSQLNAIVTNLPVLATVFQQFLQALGLPTTFPIVLLTGFVTIIFTVLRYLLEKSLPSLSDLLDTSFGNAIREVLFRGPIAKVRTYLSLEVDVRKLNPSFDALVKTKTSFYDYEKNENERLKYPTYVYQPVSIQYTEDQVKILASLVQKENRQIPLETIYQKIPLNVGEDPVDNILDFVKFGLRLGNSCTRKYDLFDLPYVKTPFRGVEQTALNYIERHLCAYGFYPQSRVLRDNDYGNLAEYVLRGFYPKDGPVDKLPIYVCPKFEAMYATLRSIRRNDDGDFSALVTKREVTERKEYKDLLIRTMDADTSINYYTTLKIKLENDLITSKNDTLKYLQTRNQLSFVNASLQGLKNVENLPKAGDVFRDPTRTYLPLVYSNFEESFQAFGAYLTSLGETYVVVHPDDNPNQRLMEKFCWDRSYPVCDSPYVDDPNPEIRIRYKRPICVLLHPLVIEGLNFTFSPALLAMETVLGYGVKQQVYARILRGFKESASATNDQNRPRVLKRIFEFQGDYVSNYELQKVSGLPYKLSPIPQLLLWKLISSFQYQFYNLPFLAYNYLAIFANESLYSRTSNDAVSPEEIAKLWNTKTQAVQEKISALYTGSEDDDKQIGDKCNCKSTCEFCNQGFVGPKPNETFCGSKNNPEGRTLCRNQPLEKASKCE